jgi:hypothetical protein
MNKDQYQVLCNRRQAFDNLVWQTPPLATAAQAFLLAASFDSDATKQNSIILAVFSGLVGLASVQLMAKHRHGEIEDAELLSRYEAENIADGFSILHGKRSPGFVKFNILTRFSSFRVWFSILCGFVALALYAVVVAAMR